MSAPDFSLLAKRRFAPMFRGWRSGVPRRPCRAGSSPISVRISWTAASTRPLPECLPAPSISSWARCGSSPISVSISSTIAWT